jgi:hypothetical protein
MIQKTERPCQEIKLRNLVCFTISAFSDVARQLSGVLLLTVGHISNNFICFKFTFSTWVEMAQSV